MKTTDNFVTLLPPHYIFLAISDKTGSPWKKSLCNSEILLFVIGSARVSFKTRCGPRWAPWPPESIRKGKNPNQSLRHKCKLLFISHFFQTKKNSFMYISMILSVHSYCFNTYHQNHFLFKITRRILFPSWKFCSLLRMLIMLIISVKKDVFMYGKILEPNTF